MEGTEQQGENSHEAAKQGVPPKAWQFKPGQSGNPGGRPKSESLTSIMRRVLDEGVGGKTGDETKAALCKAAVAHAMKGDFRYWNAIFERVDGKVPDVLPTEGPRIIKSGLPDPDEPTQPTEQQP